MGEWEREGRKERRGGERKDEGKKGRTREDGGWERGGRKRRDKKEKDRQMVIKREERARIGGRPTKEEKQQKGRRKIGREREEKKMEKVKNEREENWKRRK